jgi:hypothetical protein
VDELGLLPEPEGERNRYSVTSLSLVLALLALVQTALLVFSALQHAQERECWNRERNALIERLIPGSTPAQMAPEPAYIIGDDEKEWFESLDAETRAQVELERNHASS